MLENIWMIHYCPDIIVTLLCLNNDWKNLKKLLHEN